MAGGAAEMRGPLPLPSWEKTADVSTMDALNFRSLHRRLYFHKQKLDQCKGTMDNQQCEREIANLQLRADGMKQSRSRHKDEAARELKSENARLVERLCSVVRESETRQKVLMSTPARVAQGMLNAAFRRKQATQVDKDNKMILDRLKHAGPGIETNRDMAAKYKEHQSLVVRHSRFKRRSIDMTNPPPPLCTAPKSYRRKAHLYQPAAQNLGSASDPTPSSSSGAAAPAGPEAGEEELVRSWPGDEELGRPVATDDVGLSTDGEDGLIQADDSYSDFPNSPQESRTESRTLRADSTVTDSAGEPSMVTDSVAEGIPGDLDETLDKRGEGGLVAADSDITLRPVAEIETPAVADSLMTLGTSCSVPSTLKLEASDDAGEIPDPPVTNSPKINASGNLDLGREDAAVCAPEVAEAGPEAVSAEVTA